MWFLTFSESMGPSCPQDACRGMSITLEPHISACKPRKKIIADASIKLKIRDPRLCGEGSCCTEQSGEGRRQTAPVHPGCTAASLSLKQGSTCSESPGKIRARVAHQPAVANRRAELEYKVVHTFFFLFCSSNKLSEAQLLEGEKPPTTRGVSTQDVLQSIASKVHPSLPPSLLFLWTRRKNKNKKKIKQPTWWGILQLCLQVASAVFFPSGQRQLWSQRTVLVQLLGFV